ncbi:hypothetical protein BT96DRAFT_1080522 [Gymnopus androsaceus JB14]|uniref:Uncharacterized protein n=1 Tax=Gymnopus androsaceus JB14 TaxID=1447944 RepID=A0A6A4GQ18_9AGAR|nr:hypothetical protein BT96DRAFT_1080522 [Gymnopus androsaceus JB14]
MAMFRDRSRSNCIILEPKTQGWKRSRKRLIWSGFGATSISLAYKIQCNFCARVLAKSSYILQLPALPPLLSSLQVLRVRRHPLNNSNSLSDIRTEAGLVPLLQAEVASWGRIRHKSQAKKGAELQTICEIEVIKASMNATMPFFNEVLDVLQSPSSTMFCHFRLP